MEGRLMIPPEHDRRLGGLDGVERAAGKCAGQAGGAAGAVSSWGWGHSP